MKIALDYYIQLLENGFTPAVAKNRVITFMRNKMTNISKEEYDTVFDIVSRLNSIMYYYQSKGVL